MLREDRYAWYDIFDAICTVLYAHDSPAQQELNMIQSPILLEQASKFGNVSNMNPSQTVHKLSGCFTSRV